MQAVRGLQVRLEVAVAGVCSKRALPHTVRSAQARSLVEVNALVSYCVADEHVVSAVHWRSLVVVADTLSHWPSAHTVCARHVRSEVEVGSSVSYSVPTQTVLSWHTRSTVAEGAAAALGQGGREQQLR